MNTAAKLWIGFGLMLALLVGTGLFVAHRLASIERSLLTILAVQEPTTAATYEMAVNVIATRSAALHYASTGDTTQLSRIAVLESEFRAFKSQFDLMAQSAASRTLGERIDQAYREFESQADTLLEASDGWRASTAAFARRTDATEALADSLMRANRDPKNRDAARKLTDVALLKADITGISSAVGNFIPSLDPRFRARATAIENRFHEGLRRLRELRLSDEERVATTRLESGFRAFGAAARGTMDRRESLRGHWVRFARTGTRVERLVDEGIRSLARTDLIEAQHSARRAIRTSLIAVLLLLVAGVVIGCATAIPTARSIVRTDQELRLRMKDLSIAHQRKDEFLGVLGHELRNPLAPLSNALGMLEERRGDLPDDVRRTHEMMHRQVRSISRLVDDLLDVSRINQGKITLRREPTDLARVASEAAQDLEMTIGSRGHQLRLELPPGAVWVDADPTRLAQIATNLLQNAVKYTPEDGHITIAVERAGNQAMLRVSDDGIGIAPDMLDRVFEPFTQVDDPLAAVGGGLGIGLALVRRLVEMHGGSAAAQSEGPNRGSTFTVWLPAMASAPTRLPARRPPPDTPGARLILVVDDNRDSAESMAALLQLWGHEVRVAHDGPGALAEAVEQRPDLALLDIGLPGMDGYEVAERIRRTLNGQSMMLVALTGLGQDEDRQRALAAGFDHHITKPVSPEVLKQIVAEAGSE